MPGVRGRRYLIILAVVAGLVGLYAAVGFLLVPRWTRSELVSLCARDFGRTLSLGEVRFNPFTWTLRIQSFSLPDADGRPMLTFRRLQVAVGFSSVLRLAPRLSNIVLDGPHVSAVVRHDGKLNLADLAKPFVHPARAQPGSSRPFELFVGRLTIDGGSASYEDDSRPTPFRLDLDPVDFQLSHFSTTGSTAGSYHLTATIGQSGRLDWTGTIRAEPMSLRGTVALDALSAQMVGKFLGPVLPAEISRGTLALQGSFAIDATPAGSPGQGVSQGVNQGASPGSGQGASHGASQGIRMTLDVPRLQISGLGIRPRQATSDYVDLDRLALGDTHIDLAQHSIRVGEITLAGAHVRGWLDQSGRLNLLDLLGRPAAPAGSGGGSHGRAWRIAAADVRIDGARISLQDREVHPPADLTLGPLSARITGYTNSPQSRIAVTLRSAVNGKGHLRLTADGTLQPEAVSAKLRLSAFDLRPLQPYLDRYTALTLTRGTLGTALAIDMRAGGGLTVTGRIDIADLRTVDDELKRDFVKWQGLHIVGIRYASSPASLHIRRITAVAPYARVIIGPDHTLNVSEALHPRGAHAAVASSQAAPEKTVPAGDKRQRPAPAARTSMPMAIGLVRIASGTADYADLSIDPSFATGIRNLHGAIKGLSSAAGSRASVDLRGRVNRGSAVEIAGQINLLSASTYADVGMKFRGLELTQMTPYAVRFAGYKIASGTLDADLHYNVDHGKLNANHRLVINKLQLGEQVESPHAIKLPLRLAVALLKDRDGVIRIGLPVTGSLDDPKFRLGPLIGKALLHLLEKVVTAPFALLGHLFGGGAGMGQIDFSPGSAALPPAMHQQAAALAKALSQRPQLKLQVPAAFAPDVDRPALARRQLRAELLALARSGAGAPPARGRRGRRRRGAPPPPAGPEVLELPAEHYRLLRAAFRNAFGPQAPLPAAAQKVPPLEPAIRALRAELLARVQVSDADLKALGERRAQAIRSAILAAGGVDAGRVAVTAAAPQSATTGKKVVVKLGLK